MHDQAELPIRSVVYNKPESTAPSDTEGGDPTKQQEKKLPIDDGLWGKEVICIIYC